MSRYTRNSAILAKKEVAYGADAAPAGATDAILVSALTCNPLQAQNVNRDLIRSEMGGSEQLVGNASVQVSFEVELAGSGTPGVAPAYGSLLKACGFSETINVGTDVIYAPVSSNFDSCSIYYYDDGVLHKLLGARGDVEFILTSGGKPAMKFTFTGLDGGVTASANPALTLTGFQVPLAVTNPNTGNVTLGATLVAGVITGGTQYNTNGLDIKLGNSVQYLPVLGAETVEITQRDATGTCEIDLTAANEATFMTNVKANTTQSFGLDHGTTAGNIVALFLPKVQLINPKKVDMSGRRLIGFDLRILPSAGNDEIQLVVK